MSERFTTYFAFLFLAIALCLWEGISWLSVYVAYFAVVAVGDAFVHRLICHSSFVMGKTTWLAHALLACVWGSGTPAYWAAGHKPHHMFADKDGDPFRWEGSWSKFVKNCAAATVDKQEYKKQMQQSKLFSFYGKFYLPMQLLVISALFLVGDLSAVVTFWAVPFVAIYFVTITSGIAAHWKQRPMNTFSAWLWTATTTGFHDTHHQKPRDYNSGATGKWAWADIPARYIELLCIFKMAKLK